MAHAAGSLTNGLVELRTSHVLSKAPRIDVHVLQVERYNAAAREITVDIIAHNCGKGAAQTAERRTHPL
jgi:hypothetical protein